MHHWHTLFLLLACFLTTQGYHYNNWAVLVSSSRYWFNYRHQVNAISLYHRLRHQGFPDSRIILMLADDIACNPRNSDPGRVYESFPHVDNLYTDDIEVDYTGSDVSVANLLRVLTDRFDSEYIPRNKRLLSDENSNILIYLNGHGGDGFLKFQDREVIMDQEFADSLHQMHKMKRYREILFISDTCQASSMFRKIYSPNVAALATSRVGQSSYSHSIDPEFQFATLDRFTYYMQEFFKREYDPLSQSRKRRVTLQEMVNSLTYGKLHSDMQFFSTNRSLSEISVSEFFVHHSPNPISVSM